MIISQSQKEQEKARMYQEADELLSDSPGIDLTFFFTSEHDMKFREMISSKIEGHEKRFKTFFKQICRLMNIDYDETTYFLPYTVRRYVIKLIYDRLDKRFLKYVSKIRKGLKHLGIKFEAHRLLSPSGVNMLLSLLEETANDMMKFSNVQDYEDFYDRKIGRSKQLQLFPPNLESVQ